MKYNREVVLNKTEIQQCVSFGKKFSTTKANKSSRDFGSKVVDLRGITDKQADTIAGKLGEYAFMKFCGAYGLSIEIDFSVVNGYKNIDDGQDISLVNGHMIQTKFDIKESKKYSQWLIVESHKIDKNLLLADVYISVKVDLPTNIESNLEAFNKDSITAEIAGYAFKDDFFDLTNIPWFRYKAGMSPLKPQFVEQIYNNAIKNIDNLESLTKSDMVLSYQEIKEKLAKNDKFLNMSQKADLNFALPVYKLRNTDDDIKQLFDIIKKDQQIIHENIMHRL